MLLLELAGPGANEAHAIATRATEPLVERLGLRSLGASLQLHARRQTVQQDAAGPGSPGEVRRV